MAAWLTVDLAAIVANWRALRDRHPGAVAAVVKADAYGLGAAPVARALYAAGCRHFFTAHLAEAVALRPHLPGALLAALHPPQPRQAAHFAAHAITPVIAAAEDLDHVHGKVILHVDTGLHRLGLPLACLAAIPAERLLYVMTHLVAAERPDDPANSAQAARFATVRAAFPGVPTSFANSSGLFLGPAFASDLARPGAALYGLNPTPDRPNPMRPAVHLAARVLQVRDIPAGAGVGYNATWIAPRPSRIATIAVGYADGWPRALSGRGHASFDGAPVPLVGRVSMDLTTYDATDHPAIRPGVWLDLLGPGRDADAVAADAGTNGYEILTALGRRYARIYRP